VTFGPGGPLQQTKTPAHGQTLLQREDEFVWRSDLYLRYTWQFAQNGILTDTAQNQTSILRQGGGFVNRLGTKLGTRGGCIDGDSRAGGTAKSPLSTYQPPSPGSVKRSESLSRAQRWPHGACIGAVWDKTYFAGRFLSTSMNRLFRGKVVRVEGHFSRTDVSVRVRRLGM
jgi:hypothetical protein